VCQSLNILAHDTRDKIVDHMKSWNERSELPCKTLLKWAKLSTGKYHTWLKRYGKINAHNGKIPRDCWLEYWEKQAIVDFHDKHPLEGFRRLTFMMLDDDIVAVSPQYDLSNSQGCWSLGSQDRYAQQERYRFHSTHKTSPSMAC
jgi:hypothetical protein